jgi:hypothetical protein
MTKHVGETKAKVAVELFWALIPSSVQYSIITAIKVLIDPLISENDPYLFYCMGRGGGHWSPFAIFWNELWYM